jgi:hypothetical protein
MKRLLLLVIIIPHIVFAEDIYFKVIETTPAWEDINFPKPSNISGEIQEGSIVKGHRGIQFSSMKNVYENILFQLILYNNKRMLVYADSIIPLETQDLFDNKLLYNSERFLISSFFVNALQSNNREIVYLHDKPAFDDYLVLLEEGEYKLDWWDIVSAHKNLTITQTSFTFRSDAKRPSDLLIKNIEKTEEGYIVTVKESTDYQAINKWWNWPNPKEHELFTILLVPDGDFIDLYLGNKDRLIDTFVFVDKEFTVQLDNLIRVEILKNPVDLTRITWPRRANGSTDYLIPVISNNTETQQIIDEPVDDNENQLGTDHNNPKTNSMTILAWIAIIGGAVVVVGAVVFFVFKKN